MTAMHISPADQTNGNLCRSPVFIAVAATPCMVREPGALIDPASPAWRCRHHSWIPVCGVLQRPALSWSCKLQQTRPICNVYCAPATLFAPSQLPLKPRKTEDHRACQQLVLRIGCGTPNLRGSNIASAFCIGAPAGSGQETMCGGCADGTSSNPITSQQSMQRKVTSAGKGGG
jgi:hypothetical protein